MPHLHDSHEIIFAVICALLQIKANRQNERETENNNGQVNRRKMNEPLGSPKQAVIMDALVGLSHW